MTSARLRAVSLGFGCVLAVGMAASATQTGRLSGIVVVDGETTVVVRHALVTLSFGSATLQVATDDDGRFSFVDLPGGRFSLTVEKPGFVKSYYGSKRLGQPPGLPIALANGQVLDTLRIPLARGAVLAGTVRDEDGNPVAAAQVSVSQPVSQNGVRRFVAVGSWVTSNDQGAYRIYGLAPGEYVVRAGAPTPAALKWTSTALGQLARDADRPAAAAPSQVPEPTMGALKTSWAPSAPTAESAEILTVQAGQERDGVDIVVSYRPLARVNGVAIGPSGQPISRVMVGLANLDSQSLYTSPGMIRPDAEGHFSLLLGPGQWLLVGRGSEDVGTSPGDLPLSTHTVFTIAGDHLDNLVMAFDRGVTVSGRVTFDGQAAPMRADAVKMTLIPLFGYEASVAPPRAAVGSDGTFTFSSVAPGSYRLHVPTAPPWVVRSAIVAGRDVLDATLEVGPNAVRDLNVRLVDRPSELSGRLLDQLGRPAPEFSVVVFPMDRRLWADAPRRIAAVRVGTDGSYRVSGLPPGTYLIAAVTDVTPGDLQPSFLEELATQALSLSLGESEHKTQDLRLGGK